jgi:hypothetical protein
MWNTFAGSPVLREGQVNYRYTVVRTGTIRLVPVESGIDQK